MSDHLLNAICAARLSSALLERAILTIAQCDDLDNHEKNDLLYHLRKNRLHVDLTSGRLHQVILAEGGFE